MSTVAIGIALALAASIALNASFLLQHVGSATAIEITPRRPLATLRSLLSSPTWALGAALGLTGWALHVGALSHAPLSLVQAFVAGGIAVTVPMAAIGLHHRIGPDEKRAAAIMVLALVLLALGLHGVGRHASFAGAALAGYLAGLGALAALLWLRAAPAHRAAALSLAGGLLYGAADLAIKGMTGIAHHGGVSALVSSPWTALAALVATVGAFFAFQRGLQIGRPVTAIALMTAATNVSSVLGGFVVFGDPIGSTPVLAGVHVLAFALVGVAAWRLAPSQAAVGHMTKPV
jgi:drug/metabolite transporter (DMT)-like permease